MILAACKPLTNSHIRDIIDVLSTNTETVNFQLNVQTEEHSNGGMVN